MKGAYAWYGLTDAAERRLYEQLRQAVASEQPAAPIGDMPPERVSRVLHAVLTDGPELFRVDGKWRLIQREGQRYALLHTTCTRQEWSQGLRQMEATAAAFVSLREQPAEVRIRAVRDWLLAAVTYGFTETEGQTGYDALIRRRAVCKGISKAMQYLLGHLGVFCTLAEGSLDGMGRHVWNVVEVGGAFYHVDVCMGYARFDSLFDGEDRGRRCFLVGDETLKRTHLLTETETPRLLCTADYWRKET